MMLRASVEASGEEVDLRAAVAGTGESHIEHGDLLGRFAEALVHRDSSLAELREQVRAEVGADAVVEAAGVAGNFQRQVRIADGTGIPIDEGMAAPTAELREQLGINRFDASAQAAGS